MERFSRLMRKSTAAILKVFHTKTRSHLVFTKLPDSMNFLILFTRFLPLAMSADPGYSCSRSCHRLFEERFFVVIRKQISLQTEFSLFFDHFLVPILNFAHLAQGQDNSCKTYATTGNYGNFLHPSTSLRNVPTTLAPIRILRDRYLSPTSAKRALSLGDPPPLSLVQF